MAWICRILRDSCTGCGICVDVCGHGALRMDRDTPYPEAVAGACVGCLDCERECPFDAILMEQEEPVPSADLKAG